MSIYVACQCGQAFSAAADLAGRTLPCPTCGRTLTIPQPPPLEPVAPPVATPPAMPAPLAWQSSLGKLLDPRMRLVVLGGIAAATAVVAISVFSVWLVWSFFGNRDPVAQRPPAEAKPVFSLPISAPKWESVESLLPSLELPSGDSAGQTHRSADGRVEIWLPARATSETRKRFGTSAGLADRTRITWGNNRSGKLEVTIYLYRGRHDDLAADTRMKIGITQGLYQAYGSRISQSYHDVTHAEFTGTEAVVQVPGQQDNKFRFLHSGNYLVTLEAIGPPGFATSAPAQKFFDSLRLVAGD